MKSLIIRRLLAFCIDYAIIIAYALLLFGLSLGLNLNNEGLGPIIWQLIGFLSLTLPVFSYFFLMESSAIKATFGKQLLGIRVGSKGEVGQGNILIRNVLKFLPWELAHTGVHWVVYFSVVKQDPPIWVWFSLILPQVIVLGYVISMIFSKGERSFYDQLASTRISLK
ncbi:MAG: RDD family protein [Bacteroidota bacterium]